MQCAGRIQQAQADALPTFHIVGMVRRDNHVEEKVQAGRGQAGVRILFGCTSICMRR